MSEMDDSFTGRCVTCGQEYLQARLSQAEKEMDEAESENRKLREEVEKYKFAVGQRDILINEAKRERDYRGASSGENVHVYPNFGKEHTMSMECWCCPIRLKGEPKVVVHNVVH